MTAETGRVSVLSAGQRAAFRLDCVTSAVEYGEQTPLVQLFTPPKMLRSAVMGVWTRQTPFDQKRLRNLCAAV